MPNDRPYDQTPARSHSQTQRHPPPKKICRHTRAEPRPRKIPCITQCFAPPPYFGLRTTPFKTMLYKLTFSSNLAKSPCCLNCAKRGDSVSRPQITIFIADNNCPANSAPQLILGGWGVGVLLAGATDGQCRRAMSTCPTRPTLLLERGPGDEGLNRQPRPLHLHRASPQYRHHSG